MATQSVGKSSKPPERIVQEYQPSVIDRILTAVTDIWERFQILVVAAVAALKKCCCCCFKADEIERDPFDKVLKEYQKVGLSNLKPPGEK